MGSGRGGRNKDPTHVLNTNSQAGKLHNFCIGKWNWLFLGFLCRGREEEVRTPLANKRDFSMLPEMRPPSSPPGTVLLVHASSAKHTHLSPLLHRTGSSGSASLPACLPPSLECAGAPNDITDGLAPHLLSPCNFCSGKWCQE